jgi:tRNA (adenine22-N1)-methyltransferase
MRIIVDCLEEGLPTFDLACDHGLIGLWAWHTRSLPELHLVDRAPSIIDALERDVSRHLDPRGVHFHAVDAASLTLPDSRCNVILSGVGFRTLEHIMTGLYLEPRPDRLVTSVHAEEDRLAPWLEQRGWRQLARHCVDEAGRMRIIHAWQGPAPGVGVGAPVP